MNGAIVIAVFIGVIGWLNYLKNQSRRQFLQSKETYIRDLLARYPTSEGLEKLVRSPEWTKLMELYEKPVPYDNRLTVFFLAGLGIITFCVAIASAVLTMLVDKDMVYPAAILGAISISLLIISAMLNYYLKKWKI